MYTVGGLQWAHRMEFNMDPLLFPRMVCQSSSLAKWSPTVCAKIHISKYRNYSNQENIMYFLEVCWIKIQKKKKKEKNPTTRRRFLVGKGRRKGKNAYISNRIKIIQG